MTIFEDAEKELESKGYALKKKVTIYALKLVSDFPECDVLRPEEKRFKRGNIKAINKFVESNIPESVTFTTKDGIKLTYEPENGVWAFREFEIGDYSDSISGIGEIIIQRN